MVNESARAIMGFFLEIYETKGPNYLLAAADIKNGLNIDPKDALLEMIKLDHEGYLERNGADEFMLTDKGLRLARQSVPRNR